MADYLAAALIIACVVLALASLVPKAVRHLRQKRDANQLPPELRARHDEILAAEKAVKDARKAYETGVKSATQALALAQRPRTLAKCGSVLLTETNIKLISSERALTKGITAQVDATGDVQKYVKSRTTATRIAGGALVAGPVGAIVGGVAKKNKVKTSDTRELYLTVTAPTWQEVVQLPPHLSGPAREFAAALYTASPKAAEHRERFEKRLASAKLEAKSAKADTAALESAQAARALLGPDPVQELRQQRAEAKQITKGPGAHAPEG